MGLEGGFAVHYLGGVDFPQPRTSDDLQKTLLEIYTRARWDGERRRSQHPLALRQRMHVTQCGLFVSDAQCLVVTKVITPLTSLVSCLAVRFSWKLLRRRVFGGYFSPVSHYLSPSSYLLLSSKQRFLVSVPHPSLFACVLRPVHLKNKFECHLFSCLNSLQALTLCHLVHGFSQKLLWNYPKTVRVHPAMPRHTMTRSQTVDLDSESETEVQKRKPISKRPDQMEISQTIYFMSESDSDSQDYPSSSPSPHSSSSESTVQVATRRPKSSESDSFTPHTQPVVVPMIQSSLKSTDSTASQDSKKSKPTKSISWSPVEPNRNSFLKNLKKISARAKSSTGKMFSNLKSKFKSKREVEVSEDSACDTSEAGFSPRAQSWDFRDLRDSTKLQSKRQLKTKTSSSSDSGVEGSENSGNRRNHFVHQPQQVAIPRRYY